MLSGAPPRCPHKLTVLGAHIQCKRRVGFHVPLTVCRNECYNTDSEGEFPFEIKHWRSVMKNSSKLYLISFGSTLVSFGFLWNLKSKNSHRRYGGYLCLLSWQL